MNKSLIYSRKLENLILRASKTELRQVEAQLTILGLCLKPAIIPKIMREK